MKANKIIVSFNNGSVPPIYAYRYQIVFSEETGDADLKLFKGYDVNEEMILSESKKFNLEIFQQLLSLLEKKENSEKLSNMTGGSQRSIEINAKKIMIEADDEAGISLFNRFLYLYNPEVLHLINQNINP
ncbi:hypothetical protein J3D55_000277 [Chryseobacterium ginsenosidimutans]|uniref:hypothetical protein n=1 Tax=Chryseobacterium ginsenosidimutans TaxID=687846 RepID=UPI002167E07F|nr:hypothetical protein [Chryseobacterium ginsenosidimutans]MCS3867361.1 hypothetical protein [Chryseobacterium ginsenosidimutans]